METNRNTHINIWLDNEAMHKQIVFFFLHRSVILAQQHVNDAPNRSEEQRVDSSLCDGCGVFSKTKATWQAAGLRLDQTGLVYWTSPSLHSSVAVCETAV